jgi:hypothetical protein
MNETRTLETRVAQKGKQMDGFLSNLTEKMDVARKSLVLDQKEIRQADLEILALQASLDKSTSIIDQKRKLRDQSRGQLQLLEEQFDLVILKKCRNLLPNQIRNQTKQLLLDTHKRASALRQGKRVWDDPEPIYAFPVISTDRTVEPTPLEVERYPRPLPTLTKKVPRNFHPCMINPKRKTIVYYKKLFIQTLILQPHLIQTSNSVYNSENSGPLRRPSLGKTEENRQLQISQKLDKVQFIVE